jgi:hypothetical protein
MVRRLPTTARNAIRDRRYGALLGGSVRTRYGHLGAYNASNTAYEDLPALFAAAAVGPDDVVVDVGAGKGRVINWLLDEHRATRVIGIELDPEIAERTRTRLERFDNVSIVTGDATELLPADGTVFFLFNPFDENVVRRFATAFLASGMHPSRRAVYHNAKHVHVFRDDARFAVDDIALPSGSFHSVLIRPSG